MLQARHRNLVSGRQMKRPFFTIGHATRSIEEFVGLVKASNAGLVIDVRTTPMSRTNPQYNIGALPATLSKYQIRYQHVAALGGRRGRQRDVRPAVNGFWHNQSFHNYADYAMGQDFQAALRELRKAGHAITCVTMCAEAMWWRCHRRIIADYLIAAGDAVFHILGPDQVRVASLTASAAVEPSGLLTYPATANKKPELKR